MRGCTQTIFQGAQEASKDEKKLTDGVFLWEGSMGQQFWAGQVYDVPTAAEGSVGWRIQRFMQVKVGTHTACVYDAVFPGRRQQLDVEDFCNGEIEVA